MKSGFVALLGLPNAGKSSLLNALMSEKIAIVTPKEQTTRENILGLVNGRDYQIAFIDTPGLYEGDEALAKIMIHSARRALSDVDAVFYLIDSSKGVREEDINWLKRIKTSAPVYLLFNKIDLVKAPDMEELLAYYQKTKPECLQIQLSVKTNFNLKEVREIAKKHLKTEGELFPSSMKSDKSLSFQAKEIIREKLLVFLNDEVPHQCAVLLKQFVEDKGEFFIKGEILVEKEGQKAIVIGKGGAMIKKIGISARQEMERVFKKHVFLDLKVVYAPHWRSDYKVLAKLGYGKDAVNDD